MNRLLLSALLAALLLTLSTRLAAQVPAPSLRPLAPGVAWLPGSVVPGRQPDGNSVVFSRPEGAVVVDVGRHVAHTQALIDGLQGRPLRAVLNTHWHLDHLGDNRLVRELRPGTPVWGSDAVRPALTGWLADSRRQMNDALASGQVDAATAAMMRIDLALIDAGEQLAPDVTLSTPRTLELTGQALQVGVARHAVTAADLWVFDPRSRVLAAGDLVTVPAPFLDTACVPGWQAALAALEAVPFDTLVPGHGEPMDRAGFTAWRKAFDELLACAATDRPDVACAERWIADLGPRWPRGDAQAEAHARGLLGYYLKAVLRAPAARRDRFCPAPGR